MERKIKKVAVEKDIANALENYLRAKSEYEKSLREVEKIKLEFTDEEPEVVEILYKGSVIAKIEVVKSKRVEVGKLPPEIRNMYTTEKLEKRLIVTGIPTPSDD